MEKRTMYKGHDPDLGMNRNITRRNFVNGVGVAVTGSLLAHGGLFFLTSAGPGARVLVLDNHDDFGGHAKRNESTYRGRTLLLNGGTSNLESVNRWPHGYAYSYDTLNDPIEWVHFHEETIPPTPSSALGRRGDLAPLLLSLRLNASFTRATPKDAQ